MPSILAVTTGTTLTVLSNSVSLSYKKTRQKHDENTCANPPTTCNLFLQVHVALQVRGDGVARVALRSGHLRRRAREEVSGKSDTGAVAAVCCSPPLASSSSYLSSSSHAFKAFRDSCLGLAGCHSAAYADGKKVS